MTMPEANELVSLVCDELCHYPHVMTKEELEEKCESCPLVEQLMKEVEK